MYSAITRGQSSIQIGAISQQNADSFWYWLITGFIVIYFFPWGWSVIPFGVGIYRMLVSIILTSVQIRLEAFEERKNKL